MSHAAGGGLFARNSSETARVLQHDPDLGDAVPFEVRDAAERASIARVLRVPRGEWDARQGAEASRGGHGFLILSGLLVRRVGLNERMAAELLGPGDLLRPLEHDGDEATLPFEATWRVLDPLRLAVLDSRWSVRVAPFPQVGVA